MLPTQILAGLIAGVFMRDRKSIRLASAYGVALSVLWGILVGIGESSGVVFVGGFLLALANLVVGAAVSAGVCGGFRRIARAGAS